jgi:hypothetical protein
MTQQRRFTKEFEEEAVRLVQTTGERSARSPVIWELGYRRWFAGSAGGGIGALSTQRQQRAMSRWS